MSFQTNYTMHVKSRLNVNSDPLPPPAFGTWLQKQPSSVKTYTYTTLLHSKALTFQLVKINNNIKNKWVEDALNILHKLCHWETCRMMQTLLPSSVPQQCHCMWQKQIKCDVWLTEDAIILQKLITSDVYWSRAKLLLSINITQILLLIKEEKEIWKCSLEVYSYGKAISSEFVFLLTLHTTRLLLGALCCQ